MRDASLPRTNMYDGVREYHVQTRESGTRSEKQTESELRSRTEDCQSFGCLCCQNLSHRGPPA